MLKTRPRGFQTSPDIPKKQCFSFGFSTFLRSEGFGQHPGKSWHTLLSKTPPRCPEELEDTRKNAQDVPKLSPGPSKTPSKAAETSPEPQFSLDFSLFFVFMLLTRLGTYLARLGAMLRHLGAYLAPTWPVLAPSYSHFGPSALSKNPSKRNFLNVPNTHFSKEFSIFLQIFANRIAEEN